MYEIKSNTRNFCNSTQIAIIIYDPMMLLEELMNDLHENKGKFWREIRNL